MKSWKAWLMLPVNFPIFSPAYAYGLRHASALRLIASPEHGAAYMKALDEKRPRLRHELQHAHDAWLKASEYWACCAMPGAPVDVSGCPDAIKAKWFEYRASQDRLIMAYAEQPVAA